MPQSHFKPLQGGALAMLTLVLSLATFMLVLDSTIANVAIPTIAVIWVPRPAKERG